VGFGTAENFGDEIFREGEPMGKRRKVTSIVISLLILGISGRCWADAAEQLAAADNYLKNKQYAEAEPIYKTIAAANPGANIGLEAQRSLVILYEEWQKPTEANTALQAIVSNFSQNQYVTWEVFGIAERYNNPEKRATANKYYKCIVNNWPTSEPAMWAQNLAILNDIDLGNDAAAQEGIKKLLINYSESPYIGSIFFGISEKCRQMENQERISEFYRYILDTGPEVDQKLW